MTAQELEFPGASTVLDIRQKIIGIQINLLRIHRKENIDACKKNIDHLRNLLKNLGTELDIKSIFNLINGDRLDEKIKFTFEQIIDGNFYNE